MSGEWATWMFSRGCLVFTGRHQTRKGRGRAPYGPNERRGSVLVARVDLGPGLEEERDNLVVPVLRGSDGAMHRSQSATIFELRKVAGGGACCVRGCAAWLRNRKRLKHLRREVDWL